MSIPAEIFLERIKQSDEGITSFSLEIRLLGVTKRNITASIESDPGFENPKLTSVVDQVCLLDLERHLLLMATFTKMARFHGEGPTGRTIQWHDGFCQILKHGSALHYISRMQVALRER